MPLTRIRPRVGSWNRATRSVTVVLPAPLRPTSATTDPPGTIDVEVANDRLPFAVLELDVFEADLAHDAGRVTRVGPVRLVVLHAEHFEHALHRRQRPLQLGERVDDVPDRLSSRNVYHWNAMMSPIDGAARRR